MSPAPPSASAPSLAPAPAPAPAPASAGSHASAPYITKTLLHAPSPVHVIYLTDPVLPGQFYKHLCC